MFYDIFKKLCDEKGVSPSRACLDMKLSRSLGAKWKNTGANPSFDVLSKMAGYFDVSVDYLLGKEKAPTPKDEHEIGFNDFTYAMQNETEELTDSDKDLLLSLARQLNEARKQKDGTSV